MKENHTKIWKQRFNSTFSSVLGKIVFKISIFPYNSFDCISNTSRKHGNLIKHIEIHVAWKISQLTQNIVFFPENS